MLQTMTSSKRVGILCGGGPAPGINSVIGAATIRSVLGGADVLGIHDGFRRLMQGDVGCATPLTIEDVSRIHFTGGSQVGTSRANPTRDPRHMQAVTDTLQRLGVDALITIGGDDTAFSAMRLADHAGGRLQVVHVPKTIDNDLDLPYGIPTFGFQTARHVGTELVKNLMTDAKTTGRWYLIVAMGRKAGHLALGIGKAAGATLTVIPEEFSTRGPGRRQSPSRSPDRHPARSDRQAQSPASRGRDRDSRRGPRRADGARGPGGLRTARA